MALADDEDLPELSQEQVVANTKIVSEKITKNSLPRFITLSTYEGEDEDMLSPTHSNKENFLSPKRGEVQFASPNRLGFNLSQPEPSPSRMGLSPSKKVQLGLSPSRVPGISPMSPRRYPDTEHEEDIFKSGKEKDKFDEEEKRKLQDWAKNVYVPACRSLLEHCSIDMVSTKQVQTYLRLLANTITFFCNEHQSQQELWRVSPSRSESSFLVLCTL